MLAPTVLLHRCKNQTGAKEPFGQLRSSSADKINNSARMAPLDFLHRCKETEAVQKNNLASASREAAQPKINQIITGAPKWFLFPGEKTVAGKKTVRPWPAVR